MYEVLYICIYIYVKLFIIVIKFTNMTDYLNYVAGRNFKWSDVLNLYGLSPAKYVLMRLFRFLLYLKE